MSYLPQWSRLDQAPILSAIPQPKPIALAHIGVEGRLLFVSDKAVAEWGIFAGVKLPQTFREALAQQVPTTGEVFPLNVLDLTLHAIFIEKTGWIIWENKVQSSAQNTLDACQCLHQHIPMQMFRIRYDGKILEAAPNAQNHIPPIFEYIKKGKQLLEIIHPEDCAKLTHALREVENGRSLSIGLRLQHPKALENIRFVELHLFKTQKNKIAEAVLLDMTEQSQLEDALLFNETVYRSFLEQSPLGIVHLDETGVVVFENHRMREWTGKEPENAWLGKSVFEINGLNEELERALRNLLEKGIQVIGVEFMLHQYTLVLHGNQIIHPEGHRMGATLYIEDQSYAKESATLVNREENYKAAAFKLRDLLLGVTNEEDFLEKALPIFCEVSQAEQIKVLLQAQGNQALQCNTAFPTVATRNPLTLIQKNDFPVLNQLEFEHQNLHLRYGKALKPEEHRLLEYTEVHEAVWCPFTENGNPIGFFVFEKYTPSTNVWTKADVHLMEQLVRTFENIWGRVNTEIRHQKTLAAIDESLFNFEFDTQKQRYYTFFTPQVVQLTGYTVQELLVNGEERIDWADDLVLKEDLPLLKDHDSLLCEGRQSYTVYRIRRKNGEIRWLKESANPHRDAAKRITVGGILTDITEQKLAESALMEAKRGAENANETKTLFMATMSHELRTPLGAVSGFTDLLSRELKSPAIEKELPPQVGEFVHAIQENAKRLLNLVNDLFDLSNLETGDVTLRNIPVFINTEVQKAVQNQQHLIQNKGLALNLNMSPKLLQVSADSDRVRQMVEKLIENAVKFTDKGAISITTGQKGNKAFLQVADTGVGMSQEYVANLFTPFMQEDRKLTRKYKGVGLGLALVKRLTDLMGGTIDVQSEKDKGSSFRIWLPIV